MLIKLNFPIKDKEFEFPVSPVQKMSLAIGYWQKLRQSTGLITSDPDIRNQGATKSLFFLAWRRGNPFDTGDIELRICRESTFLEFPTF